MEHDPGDADHWQHWASSRSQAGFHEEAAEKYRKAAALAPGDSDVLNSWGSALERAGDFRGAMRKYEAAAKHGDDEALNRIANLYIDRQGPDQLCARGDVR